MEILCHKIFPSKMIRFSGIDIQHTVHIEQYAEFATTNPTDSLA
jgi:hypothetical protein